VLFRAEKPNKGEIMSENIINITGVKKYFGGVKALDGVSLDVKKGEIHCLAGENGCGKSTLINIISGYYIPDEGSIEINGTKHSKLTPQTAIDHGIQVIYQDLSVFPNLTVMENLALNMELASKTKIINKKRMHEIASQAVTKINFQIDLNELVENLSIAEKQLIAISRALLYNAKLIIMDEPTTSITKKEVQALFKVIRQLQEQNIAVLFVSHKLDEVFEIAERFTIFRNGKNVAQGISSELTHEKFTYYMTGRNIKEVPFEYKEKDEMVLEIKNLSLNNGFRDVSFSLKRGEILGITGLLGSGRTELVETIFGYNKADSGDIFIKSKKVKINSVQSAIQYGIGYVPPERIREGLFLDQPISDNITIEKWDDFSNMFSVIDRKRIDEAVQKWIKELSITVHTSSDDVRTLSGGNQQKCVLAKWLLLDLNVLMLNGPTVGVDIGAKFDIYKILRHLSENGLAIIIVSDDLPEVLSNCNRVLVMRRGAVITERHVSELSLSDLTELTADN
jgi:simple sugar transport system ATP-binding protein